MQVSFKEFAKVSKRNYSRNAPDGWSICKQVKTPYCSKNPMNWMKICWRSFTNNWSDFICLIRTAIVLKKWSCKVAGFEENNEKKGLRL